MDDSFEIPVTYKGNDLLFDAQLITYGYSYKIQVNIFGQEVFLEPDEEKSFRVIFPHNATNSNPPDHNLLKAIVNAVENILLKS